MADVFSSLSGLERSRLSFSASGLAHLLQNACGDDVNVYLHKVEVKKAYFHEHAALLGKLIGLKLEGGSFVNAGGRPWDHTHPRWSEQAPRWDGTRWK